MLAQCQQNYLSYMALSIAHYCNAVTHLLKTISQDSVAFGLHLRNDNTPRWLQVPGQLWHNGTRSISSGNGRTRLCRDFRTRRRRVKGTPGNKWVYSRRLLLRMRRKTFRLKDAAHNDEDGGHDDDIEGGNDHQNPWPPGHDELMLLGGPFIHQCCCRWTRTTTINLKLVEH